MKYMKDLWRKGSRGEGVERPNGLVSGFEVQAFLDFVVQKLSVGHQIFVPLDAFSADGTDNLEAVIEAVAAANEIESASEEAVSESLGTVFAGFSGVTKLALNADG